VFQKLYLVFGTGLLAFYGATGWMGWEVGSPGRESAQAAAARHASGGHRAVWINSYRGGK
jgi:hypothetical protein